MTCAPCDSDAIASSVAARSSGCTKSMKGCASSSCLGEAEHALPRRVHPEEVAVEVRDAEQVERQVKKRSSSSAERFRSTYTPICAPDRCRASAPGPSSGWRMSRLKNSITPSTSPPRSIGMANALRRPTRAAMAARGKLSSCCDVGNPRRLARAQTRPGRPVPAANDHLPADVGELLELRGALLPAAHPPQRRARAIHFPERAVLPAERDADRPQHPRRGLGQRGRLRQRARRLVHHQPVQDLRVLQPIGLRTRVAHPWRSPHRAVAGRDYTTRIRRGRM